MNGDYKQKRTGEKFNEIFDLWLGFCPCSIIIVCYCFVYLFEYPERSRLNYVRSTGKAKTKLIWWTSPEIVFLFIRFLVASSPRTFRFGHRNVIDRMPWICELHEPNAFMRGGLNRETQDYWSERFRFQVCLRDALSWVTRTTTTTTSTIWRTSHRL